jgi:sugar lactone lactonase YvrE
MPEVHPVGDVVAGLGEGPVWDPISRTVLWVDIPGGSLHRTALDTGRTETRQIGAPLALALPGPDGAVLLARGDDLLILPADGSDLVPWMSFPHRDNMRLNDGLWDQQGRLLIGTMVLPGREGGPAALWRVEDDGRARVLVDDLRLSNGVAWSPGGRTLYHVDTPVRRLWAHDVDPYGAVVRSRVLLEIEPGAGNPDGVTVDADGHVWVCLFGGWAVRRYTPDGRLAGQVRLPVQHPTSCGFGSDGRSTLFVTTASNRLDDAGRRAQPWAGRLLALEPGPVGSPGALGRPPAQWPASRPDQEETA